MSVHPEFGQRIPNPFDTNISPETHQAIRNQVIARGQRAMGIHIAKLRERDPRVHSPAVDTTSSNGYHGVVFRLPSDLDKRVLVRLPKGRDYFVVEGAASLVTDHGGDRFTRRWTGRLFGFFTQIPSDDDLAAVVGKAYDTVNSWTQDSLINVEVIHKHP